MWHFLGKILIYQNALIFFITLILLAGHLTPRMDLNYDFWFINRSSFPSSFNTPHVSSLRFNSPSDV